MRSGTNSGIGMPYVRYPERHVADYFELYQPEINAANALLNELKLQIEKQDATVRFNVGVNAGRRLARLSSIATSSHSSTPRRPGESERRSQRRDPGEAHLLTSPPVGCLIDPPGAKAVYVRLVEFVSC